MVQRGKIMIKRYYIEETDGKETKRTLTTFNVLDDMRNYNDNEVQEMYYEATAELVSKAHKIDLLIREIYGRNELGESDWDMDVLLHAADNLDVVHKKLYEEDL